MSLELSQIGPIIGKALGFSAGEEDVAMASRHLSGTPAQIIQSLFDQAFSILEPKRIQLHVEELNSGRMFLWHSEKTAGAEAIVHSEESDHSGADSCLQLMPRGNWLLER